ncbi:hypothetical protein HBH53_082860 [Parastagonospora nodorum]|nr:hypothetical protein HBH53_082860 [Parastagonospora nodorum]KAH4270322.1 hypothetical protein HBI03_043220 [Parastagonospora nodorum]KAH4278177.1 hypothetical protein HBI04_090590 [Parastagonospora nodorum]KAH5334350.1 hypothetical protein HBI50_040920 [Parastagonospora nodorum]KAH5523915.1 hypothetical protein HBI29_037150 [Parastagonospora nodorum]
MDWVLFGVASPTLRENFELDGSSSAAHASAQSPSSLQSSCSFFVPETPRTSATSSTFFTTQTKQFNSDFSTVSSATTVSVGSGGYDCPDCGAAFPTLGNITTASTIFDIRALYVADPSLFALISTDTRRTSTPVTLNISQGFFFARTSK